MNSEKDSDFSFKIIPSIPSTPPPSIPSITTTSSPSNILHSSLVSKLPDQQDAPGPPPSPHISDNDEGRLEGNIGVTTQDSRITESPRGNPVLSSPSPAPGSRARLPRRAHFKGLYNSPVSPQPDQHEASGSPSSLPTPSNDEGQPEGNIRVATANLDGAPCKQTRSLEPLWQACHDNKVDVLLLSDTRLYTRRDIHFLGHHAQLYFQGPRQPDVRIFGACSQTSRKKAPRTPRNLANETVGGTAIIVFGRYAHSVKDLNLQDPSGVGLFCGIRLQQHPSLPAIDLFATYLPPVAHSQTQGPFQALSRVAQHLKASGLSKPAVPLPEDPDSDNDDDEDASAASFPNHKAALSWITLELASAVADAIASNPGGVTFVGGDLNTTWDPDSPPPRLYPLWSPLALENLPAIQYPNLHTYYINQEPSSWVDHILSHGPASLEQAWAPEDPNFLALCSDHVPLYTSFRLPGPLVPSQEQLPHSYLKAQARVKPADLPLYSGKIKEDFEKGLEAHFGESPTITATFEENYSLTEDALIDRLNTLEQGIVKVAQSLVKNRNSFLETRKTKDGWSPQFDLLVTYLRLLVKVDRRLRSGISLLTLTNLLQKFKDLNQSSEHFDDLIVPAGSLLMQLCHPDSKEELSMNIKAEVTRIKKLCHGRNRAAFRERINTHCAKQRTNFLNGRLGRTCDYLLERAKFHPLAPLTDTQGNPIVSLPEAARTLTQHYSNHFASPPDTWIARTGLDEDSDQGKALRSSILRGTWRTEHPNLLNDIPPHVDRSIAEAYLDAMKSKADPDACSQMESSLNRPIPFEEFSRIISSRQGGSSPGSTGLTINMLKLTPEPILRSLHAVLNALWTRKIVPPSWGERILVPIPKAPGDSSMDRLRPIMLLNTLRKLWLSAIDSRMDQVMMGTGMWDDMQSGALGY